MFVLAVVSASVVTAFITGGFRLLSERSQRTFVLKQRQEDRTDRRLEWTRDQHSVARVQQLPMLVAVIAFIAERHKMVAEDTVGFIIAYHPQHDERVGTWDEAMAELRRISLLHPSAEVRSKSAAVQRDIQHHWVDPVDDPNMSSFERWLAELESIVELIHTPPGEPDGATQQKADVLRRSRRRPQGVGGHG